MQVRKLRKAVLSNLLKDPRGSVLWRAPNGSTFKERRKLNSNFARAFGAKPRAFAAGGFANDLFAGTGPGGRKHSAEARRDLIPVRDPEKAHLLRMNIEGRVMRQDPVTGTFIEERRRLNPEWKKHLRRDRDSPGISGTKLLLGFKATKLPARAAFENKGIGRRKQIVAARRGHKAKP